MDPGRLLAWEWSAATAAARAAGRGKELQGTTPVPLPASFPSGAALYLDKLRQRWRAGRESWVCVLCVLLSMEAAADCFSAEGGLGAN